MAAPQIGLGDDPRGGRILSRETLPAFFTSGINGSGQGIEFRLQTAVATEVLEETRA